MLSKNTLNAVIFVCLVGLIGLQIKDFYFPAKGVTTPIKKEVATEPVEPQITEKKDAPCASSYFPFVEGETFTYDIESYSDVSPDSKPTKKTVSYQITSLQPTSVTLKNLTTKKDSTLYCKEDGLYGLPIDLGDLLGPLASMTGQTIQTDSIAKRFLLIPADVILASKSYTVDYVLPGLMGAEQSAQLNYEIGGTQDERTLKLSVNEEKKADTGKLNFNIGTSYSDYLKGIYISYSLQKNVGVTTMSLNASLSGLMVRTNVTLVQTSSSR